MGFMQNLSHEKFQGMEMPGTNLTSKLAPLAPKELLVLQIESMIILINYNSPAVLSNSGFWSENLIF